MKKKLLPIVFLGFCYGGLVIANLYNSGQLSLQWAYIGSCIGFIAISVGFYGFITQTMPKFKAIYNRLFKEETTKTGTSRGKIEPGKKRKIRRYII